MRQGLAKYWDSLEDAQYLEPCTSTANISSELDENQQRWLSELSLMTEHECYTVLYAKSILDMEEYAESAMEEKNIEDCQREQTTVQNIPVGVRCQSLSISLQDIIPPPKPRRRIARLTPHIQDIDTNQIQSSSYPTCSTLDLIDSCKFNEVSCSQDIQSHSSAFSTIPRDKGAHTTPTTPTKHFWTPPGFRKKRAEYPEVAITLEHTKPPSYEQLNIQVGRNGESKVLFGKALRHSIAVNQDHFDRSNCHADCYPSKGVPNSPTSFHSGSSLSIDSGQCSGDLALFSQHSFSSSREDKAADMADNPMFVHYRERCLPGYARMASTMDHALRTSSACYSLLATTLTDTVTRDIISKTTVLIQILESSPASQHLPKYDIDVVRMQMRDLQSSPGESKPKDNSQFLCIAVRKLIEQVLQIFTKIICKYLMECGSRDRLVVIAVEHIIHISLFGDELCLEVIQCGGLTSCMKLVRQAGTPTDTTRLLLREMAILCGLSKGCVSFLSLGGLEVVMAHLSSSSTSCSIEAAGLLTQLTNPHHSFLQLSNMQQIIVRLLELVDLCTCGESLLLVTAALCNISLQNPLTVDILYKYNAISRLISAYNRPNCATIFVQEQLVTILSRLASRRYEEALVGQGAVPVLLEMVTVTDAFHSDYCRRIRYKAAVCIGTLAATGIGLKSLYNNQAYAILSHVLEMESSVGNPLNMICNNIRSQLENKYQVESAV